MMMLKGEIIDENEKEGLYRGYSYSEGSGNGVRWI